MIVKSKTLFLEGKLDKFTVPSLLEEIKKKKALKFSYIDLSNVEFIDSAGVSFLDVLLERSKTSLELINIPVNIEPTITTFSSREINSDVIERKHNNFFENIGETIFNFRDELIGILYLATDIFYWSFISIFNHKGQRKGSITQQSILIGMDAFPIVGTLSFIFGFIIALQAVVLLKQFGTEVFLADMISVSMVREMGPILTAILLAGRSGSSIASEIATMKVTEEIDALKIMAIDPIRYVVVPKFNAITLCMPLLVTLSMLIGILGGLVISVFYANVSIITFVNRVLEILTVDYVMVSIFKSIVFSWAIVIIGSYFGFKVEGGAEGVGKATTLSVVTSIFAVIVLDAIFSLIYL